MIHLDNAKYQPTYDDSFPVYWKATDEQLRSALFNWETFDTDTTFCIMTFEDIKADFDSWTDEERAEYLQESNTPDYTVYDWMRDCMMNTLHAVTGWQPIYPEPTTETVLHCLSGAVITVQRWGSDDYEADWGDEYSVRGSFRDIIKEIYTEVIL